MTDTNQPILRRAYERHLDLLLAEELECRPAFARWFIAKAIPAEDLPMGTPELVQVTISRYVSDLGAAAAGEDDLCVVADWADGSRIVLLVEDKLDAVLQRDQVERYRERVALLHSQGVAAAGVVVAPMSYLEAKWQELEPLSKVSIDEIAHQLEVDATDADVDLRSRLLWRSRQLVQLRESRRAPAKEHEPTVRVRNRMIAFLDSIGSTSGPDAKTMRTINTDWLFFKHGESLIFKIAAGVVDIYPRKLWVDFDPDRPPLAPPPGFRPAADSKKNLVLRWTSPVPLDMNEMRESGDIEPAQDALRACDAASRWIDQCEAIIRRSP